MDQQESDGRSERTGEAGFSLAELLVYMALSVIVLFVVGGLLVNALTSASTIRTSNQATTTGQLLARSLQKGVHNATAMQVSAPVSSVLGVSGAQLFVIETVKSDTTAAPVCEAWLYVPSSGGRIFFRSTATVSRIDLPTSATLATALSTSPVSAPAGWSGFDMKVNPANGAIFALGTTGQVSLSFTVTTSAGGVPAFITTSALSGQPQKGTSTCFPL
ncbi:hypothetical protein [Leifsonia sp. WHRI 6310E]|uniref:hypothetical protein n=1 Tax=Leifsonia sp. WHRI 6310E TaxID=3162562 RepID=UPI0032F070E4